MGENRIMAEGSQIRFIYDRETDSILDHRWGDATVSEVRKMHPADLASLIEAATLAFFACVRFKREDAYIKRQQLNDRINELDELEEAVERFVGTYS